jgi:thiosulfate sulfurtransferase
MNGFQEISVQTLRSWLKEKDVTVLDIRDGESYEQERIPGAISLREENVGSFIELEDKNKFLVCYCYHGISSQSAAQYFADHGFKNVYSMIGGYEQWRSLI